MLAVGVSFSFIVLLVYIALKIFITGDDHVDLIVSLVILFYVLLYVFFIIGATVMGQLLTTEVKSV